MTVADPEVGGRGRGRHDVTENGSCSGEHIGAQILRRCDRTWASAADRPGWLQEQHPMHVPQEPGFEEKGIHKPSAAKGRPVQPCVSSVPKSRWAVRAGLTFSIGSGPEGRRPL